MNKGKNNEPCAVCGRYRNRVMTVDAVVVDAGKVLLIERLNDPCKGLWALPGGYMDFDETTIEAALRELAEETGLSAVAAIFLGLFDAPSRHPEQVVSAAYLVTEWVGRITAGDDAGRARWFSLRELPSPLAFDHETIIQAALRSFGGTGRRE